MQFYNTAQCHRCYKFWGKYKIQDNKDGIIQLKSKISMQCLSTAWHTGVCLPVLVLSEFLCLSLSFPKHIDTSSSSSLHLQESHYRSGCRPAGRCLPWWGVCLSAGVCCGCGAMGKWAWVEPWRWKWSPCALSRWPPASAAGLMSSFTHNRQIRESVLSNNQLYLEQKMEQDGLHWSLILTVGVYSNH